MASATGRTVARPDLTVDFWREQLKNLLPANYSLKRVHEVLGEVDPTLAGVWGYRRVQNSLDGRASLSATAYVYTLLDTRYPKNEAGDRPGIEALLNR
jgi:hypothetical protein